MNSTKYLSSISTNSCEMMISTLDISVGELHVYLHFQESRVSNMKSQPIVLIIINTNISLKLPKRKSFSHDCPIQICIDLV